MGLLVVPDRAVAPLGNRTTSGRVRSGMRRHIAAWCIVALGMGALAACANGSTTASGGPSPSQSVIVEPSSPSQPPTTTPTEAPTPTGVPTVTSPPIVPKPTKTVIPAPSGVITLTGKIYAGAEPSCLLMAQGRAIYLLNAAPAMKLRVGQRVLVSGRLAPPGTMSHCMEGMPFIVSNAEVLSPNG